MTKQNLLLLAFAIMAFLQLWLPAQTAIQHENTLRKGEAFRFETVLVDPNDPFRGKYIRLDFPRFTTDIENTVQQELYAQIQQGQKVYCLVANDERGYAQIKELQLEPPLASAPYFPAKVSYIYYKNEKVEDITLSFPFERFYLEESKAPEAERRYNEAVRDSLQESYALVKIRKGMVVLEDVVVNGVSIVEVE
ncbi:MAG: GDYXXLXY domain-containing protein [Bacteroidota bacterium]